MHIFISFRVFSSFICIKKWIASGCATFSQYWFDAHQFYLLLNVRKVVEFEICDPNVPHAASVFLYLPRMALVLAFLLESCSGQTSRSEFYSQKFVIYGSHVLLQNRIYIFPLFSCRKLLCFFTYLEFTWLFVDCSCQHAACWF